MIDIMTREEILNILKTPGAYIKELFSGEDTTYYLCFRLNSTDVAQKQITEADFESVKDLLEYDATKYIDILGIIIRNIYYLLKKEVI